eukprot:contig_21320_g5244
MWRVVYQNSGDDEWAYGGKSDGGVLLTRKLASGEEYTFSLAGRAPLAAVDTLVLFQPATQPTASRAQDGSAAYKAAVAAAAAAATATDTDCTSAIGDDSSDPRFYVNLGAGARRVYPKGWVQRFPDARWLHVYQNNGDSAWAYGAKSNGGVLVTRPLDGGETLAWSLSGSSPLAAVDHFLWYRCATTDGSCQDGSDAYDAAVAAAPAAAAA